jgi:branched-chain amino acid transport system ATP-binding protein
LSAKPILEIKSLSKAFGGLQALNDVNLSLDQGELRALIGPNGAGKSTLINHIIGRLHPTSGKIFFKGEDITGVPTYNVLKKGISSTFQTTNVFPRLTVRENIWIAAQATAKNKLNPFVHYKNLRSVEEQTEKVLKWLHLDKIADEIAGERSHGELRVLEIALGVATEPDLLLLDEPTQGMAAKESAQIARLVKNISKDRTIMLIEHNIDFVMQVVKSISVLHNGHVLVEGTPKEISENEQVQKVYLGEE